MKNSSIHVTFKEYIIDTVELTYKAVWNCQVEWTVECIFYDAETGKIAFENDDLEFICEHRHKVTKHEFQQHEEELRSLQEVTMEELKDLLFMSPAE
jgi:hypothetical protein